MADAAASAAAAAAAAAVAVEADLPTSPGAEAAALELVSPLRDGERTGGAEGRDGNGGGKGKGKGKGKGNGMGKGVGKGAECALLAQSYKVYSAGDRVWARMWLREPPYATIAKDDEEGVEPRTREEEGSDRGQRLRLAAPDGGADLSPVNPAHNDSDDGLVLSMSYYSGTVVEVFFAETDDGEEDEGERKDEEEGGWTSRTSGSEEKKGAADYHKEGGDEDGKCVLQPSRRKNPTLRSYRISFDEEPALTRAQREYAAETPVELCNAARRTQIVLCADVFGSRNALCNAPATVRVPDLSESLDLVRMSLSLPREQSRQQQQQQQQKGSTTTTTSTKPTGDSMALTPDGEHVVFFAGEAAPDSDIRGGGRRVVCCSTRTGEHWDVLPPPTSLAGREASANDHDNNEDISKDDNDGNDDDSFSHRDRNWCHMSMAKDGMLILATLYGDCVVCDPVAATCIAAFDDQGECGGGASPRNKQKQDLVEILMALGDWGVLLQTRSGICKVLARATGQVESQRAALMRPIQTAASANGCLAAQMWWSETGDRSLRIEICDTRVASVKFTLHAPEPHVAPLMAMSHDGECLVTVAHRFKAIVWDISSGRDGSIRFELEYAGGPICALAATLDSPRVLTGHTDGTIKYWSLSSGRCIQTLDVATSGTIDNIAVAQSGVVACRAQDESSGESASADVLRVWDAPHARTSVSRIEGKYSSSCWEMVSPCGLAGTADEAVRARASRVLVPVARGRLRLFDARWDTVCVEYNISFADTTEGGGTLLAAAADGSRVLYAAHAPSAAVEGDGRVQRQPRETEPKPRTLHLLQLPTAGWDEDGTVVNVSVPSSSDAGTEAGAGADASEENGATARGATIVLPPSASLAAATFCAADANLIAVASWDGTVHILTRPEGESFSVRATVQLGTKPSTRTRPWRLLFSPDGRMLVAMQRDQFLDVWCLRRESGGSIRPEHVCAFDPFKGACAFSSDGSLLAVAHELEVHFLCADDGELVRTLELTSPAVALALTPCASVILAVLHSGVAAISAATGEVLYHHASKTGQAIFCGERTFLILRAGEADLKFTVCDHRLWTDRPGLYIAQAARNLSRHEGEKEALRLKQVVEQRPAALMKRHPFNGLTVVEQLMKDHHSDFLSSILPSGGEGQRGGAPGVGTALSAVELCAVKAMMPRSAYNLACEHGCTTQLLTAWRASMGGFQSAEPLDGRGTSRCAWDTIPLDMLCDFYERHPRHVQRFLKDLPLVLTSESVDGARMAPTTERILFLRDYAASASAQDLSSPDTRVEGGVPAQLERVPIPGATLGTRLLETAVKSCLQTGRFDVFESECLRVIVQAKWVQLVGSLFHFDLAMYLALVLSFSLSGLTFPLDSHTKHVWVHILRFVPPGMSALLWLYFAHHEVLQLRAAREDRNLHPSITSAQGVRDLARLMRDQWTDVWNAVDAGMLLLVPVSLFLQCLDFVTDRHGTYETSSIAVALTTPLLFFGLFFYMQSAQSSGILIRMVLQISMGIGYFLLILVIVTLSFTVSFFVLSRAGEGMLAYPTVPRSILSVFALLLGDFDVEDFELSASFFTTALLFVGFMVFVAIILLNLLIAIMGDKYDEVLEHATAEWRFALANIVLEYEKIRRYTHPYWDARLRDTYVLSLMRPGAASGGSGDGHGQDGPSLSSSWGGRVRAIKEEIIFRTNKRLDKQDAALHEARMELQQMRTIMQSMQQTLQDVRAAQLGTEPSRHQLSRRFSSSPRPRSTTLR